MLEIFLYNAQFLFNKCKPEGERLTYLEFREKIVESLIKPRRSIRGTRPCANFHYLMKIPATEKKAIVTRKCVKCYKNNLGRESRYMCGFCPHNPVLCVDPCFRLYHSELGFGKGYHEHEDDSDLDAISEDTS